jgi:hypothetical protein
MRREFSASTLAAHEKERRSERFGAVWGPAAKTQLVRFALAMLPCSEEPPCDRKKLRVAVELDALQQKAFCV